MVHSKSTTQIDVGKFIQGYGDNTRYELIDGELIDMESTGIHEQVSALISRKLNVEIDRLELPYFIPHRCLLQPLSKITAFRPDVIILDENALQKEPLWLREPVITNAETVMYSALVSALRLRNVDVLSVGAVKMLSRSD